MKLITEEDITLKDFLTKSFPESSNSKIKKWIVNGSVSCKSKLLKHPLELLPKGTQIEINPHLSSKKPEVEGFPIKVLYNDDHFIAFEKPVGLSTVSDDGSNNLYKMANIYLKEVSRGKTRAHIVHRLDKEVSGVIIFAKSPEMMEKLKSDWINTRKLYYAVVEGMPNEKKGTIKTWLSEGPKQTVVSSLNFQEGKLAITHYAWVKTIQDNYNLLEIEIETGRKNQIRVQLASIGHPIVGDRKYGASDKFKRRIRLHAFHFEFNHPANGTRIIIESPIPACFNWVSEVDEDYKKSQNY
jgi:23S rRNA pseudouridine1911/1915/1917 synthase